MGKRKGGGGRHDEFDPPDQNERERLVQQCVQTYGLQPATEGKGGEQTKKARERERDVERYINMYAYHKYTKKIIKRRVV